LSKIFDIDSKLIVFLTKIGQLIIINVLWVICCLPVITVGAATSAMYYSTVKTIRKDRSYPAKEFFEAFKRNIGKATVLSSGALILFLLIFVNRKIVTSDISLKNDWLEMIYNLLIVILISVIMYLFPVLSRFRLKLNKIIGLSFVMAVRFLPITIVLTTVTVFVVWLQIVILPWPCIFVVPAAWCYAASFLIEKALGAYTPKPAEDEDAWYL